MSRRILREPHGSCNAAWKGADGAMPRGSLPKVGRPIGVAAGRGRLLSVIFRGPEAGQGAGRGPGGPPHQPAVVGRTKAKGKNQERWRFSPSSYTRRRCGFFCSSGADLPERGGGQAVPVS